MDSSELLQLAEHHLRLRNYSLSSQYALESLHSDDLDSPLRRRSSLILAVSDILLASSQPLGLSPNWYSVLGVDTFCADLDSIRSRFKALHLLLDPLRPSFPVADEAMDSAWSAWTALSNPDKKSELDAELSVALRAEPSSSGGAFWTSCPYCLCIYEYAAVYEGFSLRCQNPHCRRAFHGASLSTSPPPGLERGARLDSFGCFPLGLSLPQGASCSPLVSMFPTHPGQSRNQVAARKMMNPPGVGELRGRMSQIVRKTDLGELRGTRYEYQDIWEECDDDEESGADSAQVTPDTPQSHFGVDAGVEFVEKDGDIFVQLPP